MRRLVVCAAFVLTACSGSGGDEAADEGPAAPSGDELTRVTQIGPVKATVTMSPAAPTIGDPIVLTLSVEAQAGVDVRMPEFGEALGRFQIVDFSRPTGGPASAQRYTLQIPMSGRLRIPQLRVEFTDNRPGHQGDAGVANPRELLTEEIELMVASVLPETEINAGLRPMRARLEGRGEPSFLARWWFLLLTPLLLIGVFFGVRAWRRRAIERARISAYDKAIGRLAALESGGMPTLDEVDEWYVELSAIIRRYLEDRFGLRAPELTTEEFLREAKRATALTDDHKDLLSSFLEGCDRVKFARYEPDEAESKQALDAARTFLADTRFVADRLPETEQEDVAEAA
jgi:hypothetical protein